MNTLRRAGGYAAILLTLQFVATLVILFVFLAPQGYAGATTPVDTLLAIYRTQPAQFAIASLIALLQGPTIILTTLGVRDIMQGGAPTRMRLAVIAASIASALFLAGGMVAYGGIPPIAAANDAPAFRALTALVYWLDNAAVFAAGWWLLLLGWAGLSTQRLPMLLSWLLLGSGVIAILAFLIPILGLLVVLLNVIWSIWLGVVLLRPAPTTAAARTDRS